MIGAPLALSNPALDGMRERRVNGFDSYLIFYLPRADGVSIVRVPHGARDWWSLLGLDK
jgi:toxin ParE1/3/4